MGLPPPDPFTPPLSWPWLVCFQARSASRLIPGIELAHREQKSLCVAIKLEWTMGA